MGPDIGERAAARGLTVGAPRAWSLLAPVDVSAVQAELWHEGYFAGRGEPSIPTELVTRCRDAIALVLEDGAPTVAAFAFDAPWELQALLADHADAALDGSAVLLPAFWAWQLTADEPRGWAPHRDRPDQALDHRGAPQSISLWVALTDASPDNGCMYVVPAPLDVQYQNPNASAEVLHVQCVRALPARAGAVLGWTSALLHWGGIARAGVAGRASISFEYQTARRPPPSFPLDWMPTLSERRTLIAQQWAQYAHIHEQPPERQARLAAVLDALGL